MDPVVIDGANHSLGKPRDWRDSEHGACGTLAVRVGAFRGIRMFESAWRPSAAELALLQSGAPVVLRIISEIHPVVSVYVEPTKEVTGMAMKPGLTVDCPECGAGVGYSCRDADGKVLHLHSQTHTARCEKAMASE